MNEEENKAIERFKANANYCITSKETTKIILNLIEKQQKEIEKKDKQLKGLEEIDKRRTWTVNKVISEYIPDYEIISLINRYKDESFIPRVEVEKILNDRKK